MNELWFKVRGFVAAAVALVACPCHLPLTLPLLLSLTAGTALGVFLRQHPWVVFGASTVLFVGGLYLALQWVGQEPPQEMPTSPSRSRRRRTRTRRSSASARVSGNGRPKVTLIYAPTCSSCPQVRALWRELQAELGFDYEEVNILSARGRDLAVQHGILQTPVTLINGELVFRGEFSREEALTALRVSQVSSA